MTDLSALALPELTALKADWLKQGRAHALTLRLVVRTFGAPADTHFHAAFFRRMDGAHGTAYYYESEGGYNGHGYNRKGRLWIEADGVTAANLYYWNGDIEPQRDEIFIPGPWIDELLAMAPAASKEVERKSEAITERERRRLIQALGIGILI
jgi:hypothetical protein